MTTRSKLSSPAITLAAIGLLLGACEPESGPRTDSQTNWLRTCASQADCAALDCVCGVCTRLCDTDATCDLLQGATCLLAQEAGAVAVCSGRSPSVPGLCLPRCEDGTCTDGQMCVAETCHPLPKNAVSVALDGNVGHQALLGFGATLVYAEGTVLEHPRKAALFEAMFSGLGLDILRLRNRYGYTGEDDLTTARQLVDAATENLGRAPTVMLESWSPPSSFKANGATVCQGNADSCTLVQAEDGSFDYAGYAGYWRSALEAYADAGLEPDFIGIQNNPDFVPTALAPGEGCRFLPTEGTAMALVDGGPVEVAYPGYAEALAAVVDELARLDTPPKIVAPDLSTTIGFADYVAELDLESVAALSHHLYGTDPVNVDLDALGAMRELGQSENLPLLQTEMEADGLGTAVLMHYGLVVEGISAYVQSVLVRPASVSPANIGTLITLEPEDFALQEPYFALGHYARHTDPGWVRVAAASASEELLASAWLSPERDALTVVMVNPTTSDVDAELDLGEFGTMSAQVTRTVFGGLEHAADLGGLSAEGILRVPARAIVTVALRE